MFLNFVNTEGEKKSKKFIASKLDDCIKKAGPQNVIQIITDNAYAYKGAGAIIEGKYPHIFWTPCALHTLNLTLKNICVGKNVEANPVTYAQCNWITEVTDDAMMIKKFLS